MNTTPVLASLAGMPVRVSLLATQTTPRREVRGKKWHEGRCYAKRVQSKWNKRFGFIQKPAAFILGSREIVVHPTIYAAMRRAMFAKEYRP